MNNPQQDYIFGYGSLMEQASRTRTVPSARVAAPVIVQNIARGWWIHGNPVRWSITFLGAQVATGAQCNGVVYPVSAFELAHNDRREARYTRVQIPAADIQFLDGSSGLPAEARVWFYSVPSELRTVPDQQFPIVQSYLDICMNGCFEMEETYPLAKEVGFTEMFMAQTQDWNRYWVNDRLYPRRPYAFVPRARQIDQALNNHLPDLFAQIQLESTRWGE